MRQFLILTTLAGLALAGCIAPDAANESKAAALAPPPTDRVDGMTMTETKTDKEVDCGDGGNTLKLPSSCVQRDLVATGRIGVASLPVDLLAKNGPVTITTSPGDAWTFHAVVKVRGAPNQKPSVDDAWAWSHEKDGAHALRAGPKTDPQVALLGADTSVLSARYELALPAWVVLDVKALSSNGPITLAGSAREVDAATSNGPITLALVPAESGTWKATTSNGPVRVALPVAGKFGYDVDATTSNGPIRIDLGDGARSIEKGHGTFRTDGFASRAIQTALRIETSNGPVTVASD